MRRFYAIVTAPATFDNRKQTLYGGTVELYNEKSERVGECDDNDTSVQVTLEGIIGETAFDVIYVDSIEEIQEAEDEPSIDVF